MALDVGISLFVLVIESEEDSTARGGEEWPAVGADRVLQCRPAAPHVVRGDPLRGRKDGFDLAVEGVQLGAPERRGHGENRAGHSFVFRLQQDQNRDVERVGVGPFPNRA